MHATAQVISFTIGGGIGLWIATKIFSSPMNIALAGAIGIAAGLANLIPTAGFVVSLLVMIAGVKLATRCDLAEAFISALVARAVVFGVMVIWIAIEK